MKKEPQIDIVFNKLREDKKVSRNWCLRRYITRLAAIIARLRAETDMIIEGYYVKTKNGKDYVYFIVD